MNVVCRVGWVGGCVVWGDGWVGVLCGGMVGGCVVWGDGWVGGCVVWGDGRVGC